MDYISGVKYGCLFQSNTYEYLVLGEYYYVQPTILVLQFFPQMRINDNFELFFNQILRL